MSKPSYGHKERNTLNHGQGKGDKSRTSDFDIFRANYDEIDWRHGGHEVKWRRLEIGKECIRAGDSFTPDSRQVIQIFDSCVGEPAFGEVYRKELDKPIGYH